jgi:putative transposase
MRRTPLILEEYYHIFNRGVDKRNIFVDKVDLERFFQSIQEFNSVEPIGSLYQNTWRSDREVKGSLVSVVCYCLNPNHFHLLLKQTAENGISEFMKRLGGGYTWYFNNRHKRSGSLFQGKFKSVHVDSNEYLLHLSAYINLNNLRRGKEHPLSKSSWKEYVGRPKETICESALVLEQFDCQRNYKFFAENSWKDTKQRKELEKELLGLGV